MIRPDPKPAPRGRKPKIAAMRTWKCPACSERVPLRVTACPSCKTRHGTMRTSVGGRLDRLLRVFTLKRADYRCERCGLTIVMIQAVGGELQDAHYERRGKKAVRWHPDNRAALCVRPDGAEGGCHRIVDTYMTLVDRREFFVSLRGEEAIASVDALVRVPWDRDYGEIVVLLRERGIMA